MGLSPSLGKSLYGALFVAVLPVALTLWALRLDAVVHLPAYHLPVGGSVVLASGLLLMGWATLVLWVNGDGLPMSPFPPARYVLRGPYRVMRHPIYAGAVVAACGASLAAGSGSGLFLVTPFVAALAAAWVLGFEGSRTRERFGDTAPLPPVRLAAAADEPPTAGERVFAFTHLLLPWLVVYYAVEFLGAPSDGVEMWTRWDAALPVLPWTEPVYALAYPFVVLAPLAARSRRDLRWLVTRGWLAMACIVPLWLLLPAVATAKPATGEGFLAGLMAWERAWDRPATAFPAFHATWAVLAAVVFTRRWRTLAWAWWALAAGIAASCVTTGMHAAADVVAGLLVGWAVMRAEDLWEQLRAWAERVAGSWREATLGPVRFLSHSVWAAAGSWLGLALFLVVAGPAQLGPGLVLTAVSIAGAALWAQVVEGSPQLLRPYGYYGSAVFAVAGFLVAGLLGYDAWLLAGGFAVGGSVTQALGRGRCLVQGCCHGAPCPAWLGIRYTHPRSRVARLSDLGGRPIHPTQLYSMLWMLVVAAALFRLWTLHAPLPFIVGWYFVLVGLGRFVEEHLRGEPQTAVLGGLRLYQWLALAFIAGGAVVTLVPGAAAPPLSLPTPASLAAVTGFSLLAYGAYGVDFPHLNVRFSRLV